MVLDPGVYNSGGADLGLTGVLTLNAHGNSCAVFIFQASSTLTINVGSSVVLENGAKADHVFWTVASSATLDGSGSFKGNILVHTAITLITGEGVVEGRLLAGGSITLDTNTVEAYQCYTPTPTPTASATPSPTATP